MPRGERGSGLGSRAGGEAARAGRGRHSGAGARALLPWWAGQLRGRARGHLQWVVGWVTVGGVAVVGPDLPRCPGQGCGLAEGSPMLEYSEPGRGGVCVK